MHQCGRPPRFAAWLSCPQSRRLAIAGVLANVATFAAFACATGMAVASVQNRFIATLKAPFKFSPDICHRSAGGPGRDSPMRPPASRSAADNCRRNGGCAKSAIDGQRARTGDSGMARYEIADIGCATLGEAPAGADTFFELGMMYSVGRSVPVDFVIAHKWFNLAAMRGNADAIRLRREIADQMSEAEIAQAQRAARAWLKAS